MPQTMSPVAEIPAYLWTVEGIGVKVAISRTLLAKLRAYLDHAPGDAEFGGVLMGRVTADGDGFRTQVDAFEPFPIEHRHGASYSLSSHDARLLERRLQRRHRTGLSPVGFCRSHQRRGLYLDQRDFDFFQREFRHPASIFLLVRRDDAVGAKGGVFVWEEDDMRRHASYLEFAIEGAPVEGLKEQGALASQPATSRAVGGALADGRQSASSGGAVSGLESAGVVRSGNREGVAWLAVPNLLPGSGGLQVTPGTAAKMLLTIGLPLLSFYAARQIALHRTVRTEADQVRPVPQPVRLPSRQVDRDVAPILEPKPNPFPDESSPVIPAGSREDRPPVERKAAVTADYRDRVDAVPDSSPAAGRPSPHPDAAPPRVVPLLPEPPIVLPGRPAASLPRIVATPPTIAPDKVVAFFKPEQPSSIKQAFQKVLSGRSRNDDFVAANPIERPLPAPPMDAVPLKKGRQHRDAGEGRPVRERGERESGGRQS